MEKMERRPLLETPRGILLTSRAVLHMDALKVRQEVGDKDIGKVTRNTMTQTGTEEMC